MSSRCTSVTQPLASLLAAARGRLGDQHAAQHADGRDPKTTYGLEADLLLAHVLGVSRAWLFANREQAVPAGQAERFGRLLERRVAGEPIAYLVGSREFWSLPLIVTPDVLIPRPETELLVQAALDFIPADAAWRVADLGTGSGAVALAIASERPRCEVHATENSPGALAVAARNVDAVAPGRVTLHPGNWLEPLSGRFRVIVSNPPYVAAADPHLATGDCRFEPRDALTPGDDALAAIRHIVRTAPPYLEAGGLLAFEHGCEQGEACRELLRGLDYRDVETRKDLEGRERVTLGARPL